jgi:hypothetical protein
MIVIQAVILKLYGRLVMIGSPRQCTIDTITRSTIVHRYLTGPIEHIQARQGDRPENNVRGSKIRTIVPSIPIGARRVYIHNKRLPELRTIYHRPARTITQQQQPYSRLLSWWIWVLVKYPALVLHYSGGAGGAAFLCHYYLLRT